MQLKYRVIIENPENHIVRVIISGTKNKDLDELSFFIPSWSPGSYLLREYGKNIRFFKAETSKGNALFFEQIGNGTYKVNWNHPEFIQSDDSFLITYEIYCHELTVRTSHVDVTHAFLHGPSFLMGVLDQNISRPQIEIQFPPLWSKLSTSLKDISKKREIFLYEAKDYDDLLDCPIEIGCHETDGFMVNGKEHHLVYYGEELPHNHNLKKDIKKIVETVADYFGEIPYDHYYFINHFLPKLFGGLEHSDSTALQYCSKEIASRKGYLDYLSLVAHEYFHTWNVKRIRPRELGPFDYRVENHTSMLWLAEGLTVFMDDLTILKAELSTLKEYLATMTKMLNRYYSTPGRKFHSLEQSSYNAWIKLYRPDEFTNNSSVSYYLKGGIVFFCLNVLLVENNKSIKDLLSKLWDRYKENPLEGITKDEVLNMITEISSKKVSEIFNHMISTNEDIDIEDYYKRAGFQFEYEETEKARIGFSPRYEGERVFVKEVHLDSGAYTSGINAGDELISINDQRFLKDDVDKFADFYMPDKSYKLVVNRLGRLIQFEFIPGKSERVLKNITLLDESKYLKTLTSW